MEKEITGKKTVVFDDDGDDEGDNNSNEKISCIEQVLIMMIIIINNYWTRLSKMSRYFAITKFNNCLSFDCTFFFFGKR